MLQCFFSIFNSQWNKNAGQIITVAVQFFEASEQYFVKPLTKMFPKIGQRLRLADKKFLGGKMKKKQKKLFDLFKSYHKSDPQIGQCLQLEVDRFLGGKN